MDQILIFGANDLFLCIFGFAIILPCGTLRRDRLKAFWTIGALSCILAFALTKSAGMFYNDPRPFTQGVHALIRHEPDNGFPSDHTVLCFLAATMLTWSWKQFGWLSYILASCVAICRVLVGVHHPIDVIAGAAIGIISVLIVSSLMKLISKQASAKTT